MINRVTIVGNGRVGGAIASRLRTCNVTVDAVDHQGFEQFLGTVTSIGEVLILAVKDDVMISVIDRIAKERRTSLDATTVIHVNGSLGCGVLAPFHHIGISTAAAHPFQTFRDQDATALDGIGWGVDAADEAWPVVSELVQLTGGTPVRLNDTTEVGKRRYHAAAVAASNFTYAAYELGRQLADQAGIDAETFLIPIMKRTFANAADSIRHDESFGVTGPLVRGDVDGVQRQLEAIPAELRPMYRHLSLALLEVVRGKLDAVTIDAMRQLLHASP